MNRVSLNVIYFNLNKTKVLCTFVTFKVDEVEMFSLDIMIQLYLNWYCVPLMSGFMLIV